MWCDKNITLITDLNMVVIPIHEFLSELIEKPFTHSPRTMKPWPLQFAPSILAQAEPFVGCMMSNDKSWDWSPRTHRHREINISFKVISLECKTFITPKKKKKKKTLQASR
jgi:hypothetical protein